MEAKTGILFPPLISSGFGADGADEFVEVVNDALIEAIEWVFGLQAVSPRTGLRRPAVSGASVRSKSFKKTRQIEYPCGMIRYDGGSGEA
jgi:hypothetical protein